MPGDIAKISFSSNGVPGTESLGERSIRLMGVLVDPGTSLSGDGIRGDSLEGVSMNLQAPPNLSNGLVLVS